MLRIVATVVIAVSCAATQAQVVEVPKKVLDDMAFFIGDWDVQGKNVLGPVKAKYKWQWTTNKCCTTMEIDYAGTDGLARGSGLVGWSRKGDQICHVEFYTGGGTNTHRYSRKNATTFEGEAISVEADGKEVKTKIVVEIKNPDCFVYRAKDHAATEAAGPTTELEFHRAKRDR
jgi:hypothetical protein